MNGILSKIRSANEEQAEILLEAVLDRYNILYPDWQIETLAIQKSQDRSEQIDRTIALLEKLKT